jgi:hypothetical protein
MQAGLLYLNMLLLAGANCLPTTYKSACKGIKYFSTILNFFFKIH